MKKEDLEKLSLTDLFVIASEDFKIKSAYLACLNKSQLIQVLLPLIEVRDNSRKIFRNSYNRRREEVR